MDELLIPLFVVVGIGLTALLVHVLRSVGHVNRMMEADDPDYTRSPKEKAFLKVAAYYVYIPISVIAVGALCAALGRRSEKERSLEKNKLAQLAQFDTGKILIPPDLLRIREEKNAEQILYGRDLVAYTADYFGPGGSIRPISNGMNCQNCHLEAGSKPFGNNYLAVAANYPKFRARSGTVETVYKRINDCFQRSLNGQGLDSASREMKAMEAYILWLGQAAPKGKTPKGTGLMKLKYLNRAANPDSGRLVFMNKCQSCHGADGQGLPKPEGNGRRYPPLWGVKSYNEAAGLFRASSFAGYVKANMPFGADYQNPQLTDAEAWDLAAFVNSQPRPKHPFLSTDFPKIAGKPVDHPFGPFADSFSETQHKYGPFQPIVEAQSKTQSKNH